MQISSRTRLVTSSIGAGSGGDIQFMFAEDILAITLLLIHGIPNSIETYFKWNKRCRQSESEVFETTSPTSKAESFQGQKHIVKAPGGLIDQFLAAVESKRGQP